MKRLTLITLALFGIGSILYYSMPSGKTEQEYEHAIHQERQAKNDFMKNDASSPFVTTAKPFDSLKYFKPNLKYRIKASLDDIENNKVVLLATSTGESARYLEYAWASFELDGIRTKLLLLEVMDMGPQRGKLFLAFADKTSANESYGAGRYLDLKKVPAATSIELDFNKAYNPYCAYADVYSCPFPPRGNILPVAIHAGEKVY